MGGSKIVDSSYQHCYKVARSHYENFPVASWLLAPKHRLSICAVYCFARMADDIADEGNMLASERLDSLSKIEANLIAISNGKNAFEDKVFTALADTIYKYNIPIHLFFDLLKAFKQDVTKHTYADIEEVLEYCAYSANPVGRILLYMFSSTDEDNLRLSDDLCTSLQLINFLQDITSDKNKRGRCYLPQNLIKTTSSVDNLNPAIEQVLNQIDVLLSRARYLPQKLNGRLKLEITLILSSANLIYKKLKIRNNIYERPVVTNLDKIKIFLSFVWTLIFPTV